MLEQNRRGAETAAHYISSCCATGAPVPAEIAPGLMRAPVSSRGGLGIGLYQAARQAGAAGYRLALESNRDGNVCFALSGAPA